MVFKRLMLAMIMGAVALPFLEKPVEAKNSVEVTKHSIRINNVNYRRTKAEDAALGSIGERRGGAKPYFEHSFDWIGGKIKVKEPTTVSLTTSMQKEFNVSAAVDLSQGSGSGSVGGGGSVGAEYTLVKFTLADDFQVTEAMSRNGEIMNRLKSMKNPKDVRIVNEVWVLVKGSETQTSSFFGSAEGSYDSVSGSGSITSDKGATFSFSKGSIMAYSFARLSFNHNKQKKWSKVESMKTDVYRR